MLWKGESSEDWREWSVILQVSLEKLSGWQTSESVQTSLHCLQDVNTHCEDGIYSGLRFDRLGLKDPITFRSFFLIQDIHTEVAV